MTLWQLFFFYSGIAAWALLFLIIGLIIWTDRDIARDKERQSRKEEAFQKSQAMKETKEIYDELQKTNI